MYGETFYGRHTKYINWRQFTKGTRGKQNEQLFPK